MDHGTTDHRTTRKEMGDRRWEKGKANAEKLRS